MKVVYLNSARGIRAREGGVPQPRAVFRMYNFHPRRHAVARAVLGLPNFASSQIAPLRGNIEAIDMKGTK